MAEFNAVIEKFNPYHDGRGRFTSAGKEMTFTRTTKDPKKQYLADKAIERAKERVGSYGKQKGEDSWVKQDKKGEEFNQDWNNACGDVDSFIEMIDTYVPNTDKIIDTMRKRESHFTGKKDIDKPSDKETFRDGDPGLHAIQEVNGFDGLPKAVSHSEFEQEIASQGKGAKVLYRGFDSRYDKNGKVKIKSSEKVHEFLYGNNYSGFGIMGNGLQTTTNSDRAIMASDLKSGSMVRMTLASDAKGITVASIADMRDGASFSADQTLKDKNLTAEQRTKIENFRDIICSDNGSFAAAMGYDYIACGTGSGKVGDLDYIILNRGKVIVDEEKWVQDLNR